MIIENFKKRLLIVGIGLVIVGGLIAGMGFAFSGSNKEAFGHTDSPKWYKMINFDSDNFLFYFEINV